MPNEFTTVNESSNTEVLGFNVLILISNMINSENRDFIYLTFLFSAKKCRKLAP